MNSELNKKVLKLEQELISTKSELAETKKIVEKMMKELEEVKLDNLKHSNLLKQLDSNIIYNRNEMMNIIENTEEYHNDSGALTLEDLEVSSQISEDIDDEDDYKGNYTECLFEPINEPMKPPPTDEEIQQLFAIARQFQSNFCKY